jgi:heavy metal sensor kinase
MPLTGNNRVLGLVQVGQSLHNVEVATRTIGYFLLVSVIGTLILASVAGWFLAGKALQPIDNITRTAQMIQTTNDLGRRLEFRGPMDELGRLVNTLNDKFARIEQTFRIQEQFVADSSHELRTPLTVIRGNVDLLERDMDQESRQESLRSIKREAERMSNIVSDLLLLAQLDRHQTAERRPVQLDTLLLETFRDAKMLAKNKRVELGREDAVSVFGDPDRLGRMMWNLVSNAIRYTPDGGKITLSLYRQDGWAHLQVADTGIGIAPGDIPHLFDRFYRVDKARSRAIGGTGLGLAIVKSIVDMHGGEITVTSTPGHGSTFTVRLRT